MRNDDGRHSSRRGNILADPSRHRATEVEPIRKIGIIGAGQMGGGIAHVVALSGYDVAMHDIAKERVDAAIATIDKNLARQVASGKISEDERKKALARITYAETLQGLGDADLVIEAATEDETVKRKIFVALVSLPQARRHRRHQHLVDLDHPARRRHRPARALHRPAFHESRRR